MANISSPNAKDGGKTALMTFKRVSKHAAALVGMALILTGATTVPLSRIQKAMFADPKLFAFVRPGLVITIAADRVAQDGTISVDFRLTDTKGAPLDRSGITTPGAVAVNFIAAYIPKGQTQYVDYITRTATGAVSGT